VNRPPFATDGLSRLRARAPPEVRLPFTRFGYRPGFRPIGYRSRASLSPRAFCRLLQYDDARAPPRAASIPRAARGGDLPPNAFALVLPSRVSEGQHGLTSRAVVRPKEHHRGTGPTRGKVRPAFRRASPLLEPTSHTSSSCAHCYGRRILSRVLRAPGSPTCDERTLSCRQGPRFPHRPAKGGAFPRRPEVRSTAMHVRKPARIAPHPRERGPLVHAAPAPRRAPTLCSSREPAPFQPTRDARL